MSILLSGQGGSSLMGVVVGALKKQTFAPPLSPVEFCMFVHKGKKRYFRCFTSDNGGESKTLFELFVINLKVCDMYFALLAAGNVHSSLLPLHICLG